MKNRAFIIDMDGTILQGGSEIPGAFEFLNNLMKNNIPFRVITNTVSKSVEGMAIKMKNAGFDIPANFIINPIIAVNSFLEERNNNSYYFVGSSDIKSQLSIQPNKEDVIAIGDDVLTDIKGAKDYGITSALVKTGKYKSGDEEKIRPELILENLREMNKYLL